MAQEVKQRKVVLAVEEKLQILKSVNNGASYTVITEKFGIARPTVANVHAKKDASKLEAFKKRTIETGFKKAKANTRVCEYELNNVLYI